jgi:hypothetical protein
VRGTLFFFLCVLPPLSPPPLQLKKTQHLSFTRPSLFIFDPLSPPRGTHLERIPLLTTLQAPSILVHVQEERERREKRGESTEREREEGREGGRYTIILSVDAGAPSPPCHDLLGMPPKGG